VKIVIFGAGKIARGFVGHLLYVSGYSFTFIEKSKTVVDLLNEKKGYTVNVLGNPEKNTYIKGASGILLDDMEKAAEEVSEADLVFTAVGGKNLSGIVEHLKRGICLRIDKNIEKPLNVITCENWSKPAKILEDGIKDPSDTALNHYINRFVGVTESVVMRSAIEPTEDELKADPLAVNVQDYWEFPIDRSRLKGDFPDIVGAKLLDNFQGFLDKKFYTYNAANGTVAYIGYLKGYKYLYDAANDEEILKNLKGVYRETSVALSQKYGYDLNDQLEFTKTSLRKLQDKAITDYIERNARDPIRKLGPSDRLVGPARMVMECGIEPVFLAESIAAAMFYDEPQDPIAQQLKEIRLKKGIDFVLKDICKLDPDSRLAELIKSGIESLRLRGWIKE